MTIGERIKQIRKKNDKTQEEFAQKLLISGKAVSKLEKGVNNPSDQTIMLICREFHVNETWLRTGEGEMYVKTTNDALDNVLDQYALPRELRGLFLGYLGLSDNAKAELRGMLLRWAEDAARPAPVRPERNVHDWTDAEMHAALQRQLDAEKEETDEPSTSCSGNSGAAIA